MRHVECAGSVDELVGSSQVGDTQRTSDKHEFTGDRNLSEDIDNDSTLLEVFKLFFT